MAVYPNIFPEKPLNFFLPFSLCYSSQEKFWAYEYAIHCLLPSVQTVEYS